ncbi:MAG TPA: PLP-dependent aminotransferase family protein [Alphaproteobacteria bacterium]|nr:PLP-dependent aminotransferase family protein [Alphaproteobacteria bacterium]
MDDFRTIADALAADIVAGRLLPGDRLPPQREFAYRRGIAASTASRVYAELIRRGLVTGEVGRGTYVRAASAPPSPALSEPAIMPVDLELNFSVLPHQVVVLTQTLTDLLRHGVPGAALRPVGAAGTPGARETAARFLARAGWMPDPAGILFTGNGRQAIAASLAALAPTGERIGVEAMTYPVVKGIAARLGILLVPLALDQEGLCPRALARAHRTAPLRGVYLQPALHNPLGITMGARRRAELASLLQDAGLLAVEDAVYSFLADEEPLAALAPGHTILIDSLSKRIAPGVTLGFIAAPPGLVTKIATAVRSGAWAASGFPLAAGLHWMSEGTAAQISAAKRTDAAARQGIARKALSGLALKGDPRAYHLWLELPDPWRAETYAAAAARQGIAVTPASAFAISPGHAPNAVRLALASPPHEELMGALKTLRRLVAVGPEDIVVE